jgi:restriction endonuclease Mrr
VNTKSRIANAEAMIARLEARGTATPTEALALLLVLGAIANDIAAESQVGKRVSALNISFDVSDTPENRQFKREAEQKTKENQAALNAAIAEFGCAGMTYDEWVTNATARIGRLKTWKSMSGREFEQYIAEHLNTNGFAAKCTRATGDGGIDVNARFVGPRSTPLIASPFIGGLYAIQCKRYGDAHSVGEPAIRDFYGAVIATSPDARGVFITTSRFTTAATVYAAKVGIQLVDGAELDKRLAGGAEGTE